MKKLLLLLLFILLVSCAPKTYIEPTVGMRFFDFIRICSVPSESQTTTNTSGETKTVVIKPTDFKGDKNPDMCVGKFIFINDKLDSITR